MAHHHKFGLLARRPALAIVEEVAVADIETCWALVEIPGAELAVAVHEGPI